MVETLSHIEGDTPTQDLHSCKGNLLPDFETWLEEMIGTKPTDGDGDVQQQCVGEEDTFNAKYWGEEFKPKEVK